MKKATMILALLLAVPGVFGQDITGQWNGVLKVNGTQLRLVFNISKSGAVYSATMDSPDQGARGIPVTSTTFENSKLNIVITNLKMEYSGELKGNAITGIFKQNGLELPMDLSREEVQKQVVKHPQEPVKPYPYYEEDVTFQNVKENFTLSGTLTLPKKEGKYPAVILITGSGPQNRNEEIMGHKPFLVLSDYLTKQGIAVLRYDDRGVGQSKGVFKNAITADFATDAKSALVYLKTRKEIIPAKIGLVGHSEGGIIAPMVAAGNKDVDFIVLLAGTGIRGDKLLLLQEELIARATGVNDKDIKQSKDINTRVFDLILKSDNDETLKSDLENFLTEELKKSPEDAKPRGMTTDEIVTMQLNRTTNPWMLNFIRYDPAMVLGKVKCPVLAVNGDKDLQVPSKVNLPAIENALKKGGNKQVTTKEFAGLNHLFQECKTGAPSEYADIEQTFSPVVMDEVAKWILKQTK